MSTYPGGFDAILTVKYFASSLRGWAVLNCRVATLILLLTDGRRWNLRRQCLMVEVGWAIFVLLRLTPHMVWVRGSCLSEGQLL